MCGLSLPSSLGNYTHTPSLVLQYTCLTRQRRVCPGLAQRVLGPAGVVPEVHLVHLPDVEGVATGLAFEELTISLVELLLKTVPGNL